MNVPTQSQLMHLKIQAALREYNFTDEQMKYLGIRDNEHWYLVGN